MRLMLAMALFLSAMTAGADIVIAPGVSYSTHKNEVSGVTVEEKDITYDIKGGYLHPSGLYLGGQYSLITVDDFDGFSVAATIGYQHYAGFYAMFNYHLMGEMDIATDTTMTDGMGPQVDIGWAFPITHMFYISPQVTYRSINYKKIDAAGTTADIDVTRSDVMPYVTFWFKF